MPVLVALVLIGLLGGCATSSVPAADARREIDQLLDGWHRAAAAADETRYFSALAESSIFFGTDATERWTKQAFFAYAHPYFAKGRAWTFIPRSRNVYVSSDRTIAWFDEVLDSASYGELRGTGVARRYGLEWKIEQYNLTIPIPNDLANEFVAKIRALEQKK